MKEELRKRIPEWQAVATFLIGLGLGLTVLEMRNAIDVQGVAIYQQWIEVYGHVVIDSLLSWGGDVGFMMAYTGGTAGAVAMVFGRGEPVKKVTSATIAMFAAAMIGEDFYQDYVARTAPESDYLQQRGGEVRGDWVDKGIFAYYLIVNALRLRSSTRESSNSK